MKKIFALYAAALLLSACDYAFDPKIDVTEDRMFLQSYVSDADTTFIRLSRTVPLDGAKIPGTDYKIEEFRVRAGGQDVEVRRKDDWRWYFLGHNAPGTALDVYVKAAGVEPVSAQTVVPDAPRIAAVRQDPVSIGDRDLAKVTVTLADDPVPDAHYGIAYFLESHVIWTTTDEEGTEERGEATDISSMYPTSPTDTESIIAELEEQSWTIFDFNPNWDYRYGNAQILVLSGREIQDRTVVQYYNLYEDSEHSYDWGDGYTHYSKASYRWKVKLYRLSDACYNYMMARNNEGYSELAMFGLIPPCFTYSNVDGGYGAFVSLSSAESPWHGSN